MIVLQTFKTKSPMENTFFILEGKTPKPVTKQVHDLWKKSEESKITKTDYYKKDNITFCFLSDFTFRRYVGKNFLVMYIAERDPVTNDVAEEFFDNYDTALSRFDELVQYGRQALNTSFINNEIEVRTY
jgi:hypothetical protein